jgi:mono/diheme cytochrome c family protein
MDRAPTGKRPPLFLALCLLGFALAGGCAWVAQGFSFNANRLWAGVGTAAAADRYAVGKQVFRAHCTRCHTVGGGETAGASADQMAGPDLSRVGADPEHTRQWLMDTIRDPQAENRLARMPKFEGKLTEGELLALVDYLASLGKN